MFVVPQSALERAHDVIRLADWVELNLVMDEEAGMSIAQITGCLAEMPPDDARDSEFRYSYESEDDPSGELRPGFWEMAEERAESSFTELTERAAWLGDSYPMEIDAETVQLSEDPPGSDVYRFLMLLRARQLYPDAIEDDANVSGRLFESLVKHALGAYANTVDRVRFGVAGGYRGSGLPDPLPDAVEALRRMMHEEPGSVPSGAEGDYKADAIAWKPFGDRRPGQLVVIGQATISEGDWTREKVARRWTDRQPPDSRLINFLARPVTVVAFPETLSLTPSEVLNGLVYSSIPIDRLRLASLLRDSDLPTDLRDEMNSCASDLGSRLPQQ